MATKLVNVAMYLICTACSISVSIAKDVPASEPQFEDAVAQWNEKTGRMIELPREIFEVKLKVKALGYGGGESQLVWSGSRCTHRVASQIQPGFVVRVASQKSDPRGIIQFYKVATSKEKRILVMSKAKLFSGGKSVVNSMAIEFDARAYATSSFIFKARPHLAVGEYVLSTVTSSGNSSFCFGID